MSRSTIPTAIPVGPLPRNWARAYGYTGSARYVLAWWEPAGDEARYSDGRITADGNWWLFLELIEQRLAAPLVPTLADTPGGRYARGSSDAEASLVLDLLLNWVYVAPRIPAQSVVRAPTAAASANPGGGSWI